MKHFLPLFIFFFFIKLSAQGNQQWGSYFSYTNVVDIAQSDSRVFAASESAMFTQNVVSGELKTITSVDGLKGEGITAVYHSTAFNRTLVGNSNGLLNVINGDNTIVNKRGIVEETTVLATKKKINSFYENNGLLYISCDFGIVVFNLQTLEFGDTFYLGPNGAEIPIKQITIHNGNIYAATYNGFGIRKGRLDNPNLNDYTQWETIFNGYYWDGIVNYNGNLIAMTNYGPLFRFSDSGNATVIGMLPAGVTDMRVSNGYMVITSPGNVNVYNDQLTRVLQINAIPNETETVTYSCATIIGQTLYIGTQEKGLYTVPMNLSTPFINITPNGPLRNNIFSLEKARNSLWAVFGTYDYNYVPRLQRFGASKYTGEGWENIPYSTLAVFGDVQSISDITIHPNRQGEVYLNSFHNGLLKLQDDVPVTLYKDGSPSNSLLAPVVDGSYRSIRINGGTFDSAGNLWMTNSRITRPLKVLRADGSWGEYSFEGVLPNAIDEFGKMVIDKNNTKWIPTYGQGLLAYNELLDKSILVGTDNGLPVVYVKCVALDNSNRLWIGTVNGLRIIQSVDSFVTENNLEATNIVFLEDGVPQELMNEQSITDIVTDGSNNKWIGTAGAGAFLVSPDGQSTLFHFTKDNSPLPGNNINDIEIDDVTGEVFFATDRGMVSYKGTSTAALNDLNNVYVYPNPVRPGFEGDVKISGLINRANVKITDIEGNLVYETTSEGGTILWDTRAFGKYKVRSGVYMIFISSDDATLTKVKKVMIVR